MPVTKGPPGFSLDFLLWKLIRVLPPSLTALLDILSDSEDYADFLRLVEMVLPEELENIKQLAEIAERLEHFSNRFERRYFPLTDFGYEDWDEAQEYRDLLREIPIPYHGMDSEELHEPDNIRDGLRLMGTLHVRSENWEEGIALVWFETCEPLVNVADLLRIPPQGWTSEELHGMLDGTDYQGAAHWADYMSNNTGNAFLDCWAEYPLNEPWSMEDVEALTQQYLESEVIWAAMVKMSEWLEDDLRARFHELVTFILENDTEATEDASEPEVSTLADAFRINKEEQL